jgi:hypothetical protein
MTETAEQRHATLALRLLLDEAASPPGETSVDWHLLLTLARHNVVLVRLADRLARTALRPPALFTEAAERERERARAALAVIGQIAERCARHGVEFLFPNALQHYPDLGGDLDLLVLPRSQDVDALILDGLGVSPRPRDLRAHIAGAATYGLPDAGLVLDVRHGRLGRVGEHGWYPAALIRSRRRRQVVAGAELFAPAPEDQLVLQGMNRISGRRALRIADVLATVATVRTWPLDWSYVASMARALCVFPELCCYLGYVDQIHQALYGGPLIPADARSGLVLEGWGRVVFRGGGYQFPAIRVRNRLYWRQLASFAGAGDWRAASRLCLVPVVVAAERLGRWAGSPREAAGAAAPAGT